MKRLIFLMLWLGNLMPVHAQEPGSSHPLPGWYDDAKFGIFIHWGLYSVPAWAEPGRTPDTVKNWPAFYTHNPYAEWYYNTIRIDSSPAAKHHQNRYGKDFSYYQFSDSLGQLSKAWRATEWTDLIKASGARYLVFTTKHHDGFTLFPSGAAHPLKPAHPLQSQRDYTGELATAARAAELRFGTYYSGGLDWSFLTKPIMKIWPDLFQAMPRGDAYRNYAEAHIQTLIERYQPDILWNDIQFPSGGALPEMIYNYKKDNPDLVINDRWGDALKYHDFATPEYRVQDSIGNKKWETCRGIGHSFGFNQLETDLEYLSTQQLIELLLAVVSHNGNLLLNIGPDAAGQIPSIQRQRLIEIGKWLAENGEGIYGTRPWVIPVTKLRDSLRLFSTAKDNRTYLFIPSGYKEKQIQLTWPDATVVDSVTGPGSVQKKIRFRQGNGKLLIRLRKQTGLSTYQMIRVHWD